MALFTTMTLVTLAAVGTGMAMSARQTANKAASASRDAMNATKGLDTLDTMNSKAMKTAEAATAARRRAISRGGQTTFTSPLGTGTQASTARSSLLGV